MFVCNYFPTSRGSISCVLVCDDMQTNSLLVVYALVHLVPEVIFSFSAGCFLLLVCSYRGLLEFQ